jgi:hypothetical protein
MNERVIDTTKVRDVRDQRPSAIVPLQPSTPMEMLQVAVSQGADLAKIEKLMDLQERWEANNARKAYVAAMVRFKESPPTIHKNKHVHFQTKSGDRMDYHHATHDEVTNKIAAALAANELSHSWTVRQEGNMVYVKCTITHAMGHSESVELFGAPDNSGLKSPLQAIASTTTFLQRYTLLAITGLSTSELGKADDDGGGDREPKLNEEQVANMKALLTEVDASIPNFLRWAKVKELGEIQACNYDHCMKTIEGKRK